MTVTEESF